VHKAEKLFFFSFALLSFPLLQQISFNGELGNISGRSHNFIHQSLVITKALFTGYKNSCPV
jgi:hypothetical protein